MNKILTFIDSSILLAAWRGVPGLRIRALTVLSEARRRFTSSAFVRLEVRPKAVYFKNKNEVEFYDAYFKNVDVWADETAKILVLVEEIAEKYGLNGLDALHISAAVVCGADEFVTAERPNSPLSRVKELKVISVR